METADYAEQALRVVAYLNGEIQKLANSGVKAIEAEQEKAITGTGAHPTTIATILGRATELLPQQATRQDELDLL